ncbi:MAG: phosphoribosylanthranilate isomerase [Leptospirales bacterium]|nr:phosphoribosylanthranilate isomerase [Leptospirales bacterium]
MLSNTRSLIRVAGTRPLVKICGNLFFEDSLQVAACRPDFMGWIFSPRSKRRVTIEAARQQIESIYRQWPEIHHVAVFASNPIPYILSVVEAIPHFDFVQTSDGPGVVSEVREMLRGYMDVIPAFRVKEKIADPGLSAFMPADWVLLDSYVPGKPGGTGVTLDPAWVSHVEKRFLLAGGLTPTNVVDALRKTGAWGADVSSGVESGETPGRKDLTRVREFVRLVKSIQVSR